MLKRLIYVVLAAWLLLTPLFGRPPAKYVIPRSLGLNNAMFIVKLLTPISTKTANRGDTFTTEVLSPANFRGGLIKAKVTKVQRPRRRRKAEISFAFDKLDFRGEEYLINANVQSVTNSKGVKNVDDEGEVIGKSSKKKVLASIFTGIVTGGVYGKLRGGNKDAVKDATLGAMAGYLFATIFTTSGSNIEFVPGATFTLVVSGRGR